MPAPPLTYALQPDEKIKHGFIRVIGEVEARGNAVMRSSSGPTEERVHDGRLLIKRLRALLWSGRPALSASAYTEARAQLRKAAGLMAGHRDLVVTQATLAKLAKKSSKARDRDTVAEIGRTATGLRAGGEITGKAQLQALQSAMRILCRAAVEIKQSAARPTQWPSPSNRVKMAFQAMYRAGKKARHTRGDTEFHTWRKKTKRLLYLLQFTEPTPERRMARTMERIDKLQDELGAYHDAVVVGEHLRRVIPPANRALRLLDERKTRLRKRACKIARKL